MEVACRRPQPPRRDVAAVSSYSPAILIAAARVSVASLNPSRSSRSTIGVIAGTSPPSFAP